MRNAEKENVFRFDVRHRFFNSTIIDEAGTYAANLQIIWRFFPIIFVCKLFYIDHMIKYSG